MLLSENNGLPHIGLPLLQHGLDQITGKPGAHGPLPVLLNGGVGPHIPVKNGKFVSHALLEIVQKRRLILRPVIVGQLIGQHIGAAHALALQHGHCKPVKHQHTQHHHCGNAHAQHDRHQVSYLAADAFRLVMPASGLRMVRSHITSLLHVLFYKVLIRTYVHTILYFIDFCRKIQAVIFIKSAGVHQSSSGQFVQNC